MIWPALLIAWLLVAALGLALVRGGAGPKTPQLWHDANCLASIGKGRCRCGFDARRPR